MRTLMLRLLLIGLLVPAAMAWLPRAAGAAGSCTVTSCTPDGSPPCGGSIGGTTNCGTPCTVNGTPMGACVPDGAIACGSSGPGHDATCGLPCTAYGAPQGSCVGSASCGQWALGVDSSCGLPCWIYGGDPGGCVPDSGTPACDSSGPGHYSNCPSIACTVYGPSSGGCSPTTTIACGQTGAGVNGCGQPCIASGPSCTNWQPYGYIKPGDPHYGFTSVMSGGSQMYADMDSRDLVGLVAKGNIIVGDYTSSSWQGQVLPLIDGSGSAKTRSYGIDASDADLGYHTGDGSGVMFDSEGRPIFNGDYTAQDMEGGLPATKPDGSARHFYEADMNDAAFQALLAMPASSSETLNIDGVLFTNHALAGWVNGRVTINGSMVSRDDGLMFTGNRLRIMHDPRLSGAQQSQQVALPFSIQRPSLCGRVTCPHTGCTSAPPACQ